MSNQPTRRCFKKIAETAMTGKGAEASKDKLCDLVVKAVTMVTDDDGTVDIDNIKVEKKTGGSIEDSEIVEGVLVDKERVHPAMPKKVTNAKILLLNAAVEFKKTEVDAEINITHPEQLQAFLDEEERMVKKYRRQDCRERCKRPVLPEGHRRYRTALPCKGRHLRRPPCQEERHGEACPGNRWQPCLLLSTRSARKNSAMPALLRSARFPERR